MLAFEGVSRGFQSGRRRVKALDGVSLDLSPGKVTGLIGPDGAGKTTLMRLACGLLRPDTGQVRVLGLDAAEEPEAVQARIGYMPQRFGLYEDLSVQEDLDLFADRQGVTREARPARYAELMRLTGLAPFTGRLAGRLSGGMKQKLGLACALIRPPPLLLLDEPTVGVDPVSRRELWSIVYGQVRDAGMTVLLSTAYLDEAERCDQVILMLRGRVLGHNTPATYRAGVAGRGFEVSAPAMGARRLQTQLSHAPGVLDAVIAGDRVRIVTTKPVPPDPRVLLPGVSAVSVVAVPPRFEDAFVVRIQAASKSDTEVPQQPFAGPGAAGSGEEVIRVRGLERRFGDFVAVKGIDFSVCRGEIFGLLGANGAGKTTTFRMLCGLLPASGGELAVAGHDLRRAGAAARRSIGYMAQHFSLYGHLTVLQNLRFFASAYGLRGGDRNRRIARALETFGLAPYSGANAGELPLGYKQRLAFAVALMHEPEILFLDEPTSGVDPLARRAFWTRTNTLAEAGVTVLVTTHFMEEADYCDRLVIMADGSLLAEGTPAQMKALARDPQHPEPSMEEAFIRLIGQAKAAA